MNAEQRDTLLGLQRASRNAWADAADDPRDWPNAYAADDAFEAALYAIEVTE